MEIFWGGKGIGPYKTEQKRQKSTWCMYTFELWYINCGWETSWGPQAIKRGMCSSKLQNFATGVSETKIHTSALVILLKCHNS